MGPNLLLSSAMLLTACELPFGERQLNGTVNDEDNLRAEVVEDAVVLMGEMFDGDAADEGIVRPATTDLTPLFEATTDRDGRFELAGLPPERVDLYVVHPAYFAELRSVSLKDGSQDLEIELRPFVFDIEVHGWRTAAFLPLQEGTDFGYNADDGFMWLALDVEARSWSRGEESISAFTDRFDYVNRQDLVYGSRMMMSPPQRALPERVAPLGSVRGEVYFEVPIGEDPAGGVLVPDLVEGPSRVAIAIPEESTQ